MQANFITIPFKIEGAHGGFSVVNGMAKISRAGIILEFEAKIFGMMKTGVKEVRVPINEIEELQIKKRFFKFTLEIWLNDFKTISEIPNKDGRIVLQISKGDFARAEQGIKVLRLARAEKDALEMLQTPVSRLFGNDTEDENEE
ncbi:MAG: hypothetical protein ABIP06_01175 [Pyrinomonadaceae bacterium]